MASYETRRYALSHGIFFFSILFVHFKSDFLLLNFWLLFISFVFLSVFICTSLRVRHFLRHHFCGESNIVHKLKWKVWTNRNWRTEKVAIKEWASDIRDFLKKDFSRVINVWGRVTLIDRRISWSVNRNESDDKIEVNQFLSHHHCGRSSFQHVHGHHYCSVLCRCFHFHP